MKLLLIIYLKDVVKCSLKILGVNVDDWETVAGDRSGYLGSLQQFSAEEN